MTAGLIASMGDNHFPRKTIGEKPEFSTRQQMTTTNTHYGVSPLSDVGGFVKYNHSDMRDLQSSPPAYVLAWNVETGGKNGN